MYSDSYCQRAEPWGSERTGELLVLCREGSPAPWWRILLVAGLELLGCDRTSPQRQESIKGEIEVKANLTN